MHCLEVMEIKNEVAMVKEHSRKVNPLLVPTDDQCRVFIYMRDRGIIDRIFKDATIRLTNHELAS